MCNLRQLRIDHDDLLGEGEFLGGGTQCVALIGIVSYVVDVISGVPQGSVLGLMFLLIKVNDITRDMKTFK